MKNPILSILVLVSNRPDTVSKCLDSLVPILENVPSELILTDTGCGENVRKIIEKYDAKILEFEWCKDFAKARNVGLKEASGEWILYVDDDEWFEDTREIIEFFNSLEYKNYGYATYVQRNYQDYSGDKFYDFDVARMYKRIDGMQFEYAIHEKLNIIKGNRKHIGDYVHHYGYVYNSEEERIAHKKRNLEILEEENKNKPYDIQLAIHYVAELVAYDYEKAREVSKRIVDRYKNTIDEEGAFILVPTLVDMYFKLGDNEKAKEYAAWALKENINDMQRANVCAILTLIYSKEDSYEKAYENAAKFYNIYKNRNAEKFKEYINPLNALLFENDSFFLVMRKGIVAAFKIGEVQNGFSWFYELNSEKFNLVWKNSSELYMKAKKYTLLDNIFENLDVIKQYISELTYAEWEYGVYSLMSVCDKEHIEKIAEVLLNLSLDDEERILTVSYAYDRRILQDKNEYKKLMQFERIDRIYSFAYDVENRCKMVYSPHVLDDFENYLNIEEIFGLKFMQILQCVQNGEFDTALAITKTMVTSESVFLDYVKDIVKFINEEAIESRFDPQMKELAMQIKSKIRELKQSGDEEAAIETEKMLRKFYE